MADLKFQPHKNSEGRTIPSCSERRGWRLFAVGGLLVGAFCEMSKKYDNEKIDLKRVIGTATDVADAMLQQERKRR